ncbi:ABC transporter permease [Denitratisoma sp. DHT3]|uniref:ABC transporter permease n=1 Tax=Denitratisoma sp. DHT3 TaxID=1981880 RepID=UPI0011989FC3|nr:FtsX-like permease family protein [Denitratisoma sp. DHT3]QDX82903.1 ABC transporter permease [Denitratisoma sp. DHT3]
MLRMLIRDARAGELNVLGFALALAVAALTSVSFLTDRVEQALVLQSHELLGGDLLLSADHPWPAAVAREAQARGLAVAESASFPSMVIAGGHSHLADIKAVSPNYPLRGTLRVASAPGRADAPVAGVPASGSVWVDERLLSALGLAVGDTLRVGTRELRIAALLTLEPERGLNLLALGPRVLMNQADLSATGLVQPGSRIAWHLHLAAGKAPTGMAAVAAFHQWMEPRLERGEKLETMDNARPEVRQVLERAQRFLRLAALLAVVLAAVAVGLAARRYMRRHLDGCAVLRCLGASSRQVLLIHGGAFVAFGLVLALAGTVAGYGVQALLQRLLAGLVAEALPPPSWTPWAQGLAIGLTLVVGFALPPLLRLRRVSTLRVLRRETAGPEPVSLAVWFLGAAALAGLMFWVAGDVTLGSIVLGGFAAAFLLYGALARLLLALLGPLRHGGGIGWRYGLASLRRRLAGSLIQALALGLGLTTLLLITVARDDLLAAWKSRVPADAPNRFAINIQPEQRESLNARFRAAGLAPPFLEPMVRGRLVAINGRPTGPADYADERAQRLMDREFNLSWGDRLPDGNRLQAGHWHGAGGSPAFSVELGLAETLGLKLGDVLTYDIAGNTIAAPITSLRKLDWDSMRVNFFVIAAPGMLEGFPVSYITSFHLPAQQGGFVDALVRALPNLTVIDVASVVRQLQDTLDQVARAVQAVFGFSLLAGLAVLYAALQSSADERAQELAVLRALGARGPQLRQALAAEFAALGLTAGLLAGIGASLISMLLARLVFHLPYAPDARLLFAGVLLGLVLVLAAGLLGSRKALSGSPLQVLREAL